MGSTVAEKSWKRLMRHWLCPLASAAERKVERVRHVGLCNRQAEFVTGPRLRRTARRRRLRRITAR